MEDQLISFETAKLAKEKGFKYGFGNGQKYYFPKTKELTENHRGDNYAACTQSLLQKWLRDVHNIHIRIDFEKIEYKPWYFSYHVKPKSKLYVSDETFNTYEEALESALRTILIQLKI